MGAGSSSSANSAGGAAGSSARPNALINVCRPSPLHHRVFSHDKLLVWRLLSAAGLHCVRLEHDLFLGRRRVLVDGVLVARQSVTLLDRGGVHDVRVGDELTARVAVLDQGDCFGYALSVGEPSVPFAKYRAEVWKYAALWLLPKSGRGEAPHSAHAAAAGAAGEADATSGGAGGDSLGPQRPPAVCFLPLHYSVIVLPHPTLSVLVDGRPVRHLVSAFSDAAAESGGRDTDATKHRFWLRRLSNEEAKRCAPREEDEWEPMPPDDDARRPSPLRSEPPAGAAADDWMEVELTVWMDAPVGAAARTEPGQLPPHAAVARDKKYGRFRYALRVDGRLLTQAVNPMVGVHDSLERAADKNDGDEQHGTAPTTDSPPVSAADSPAPATGNDVVLPTDGSMVGLAS